MWRTKRAEFAAAEVTRRLLQKGSARPVYEDEKLELSVSRIIIIGCSVVALNFLLQPRFSVALVVSLATCHSDELLHVELAHLAQSPLL
jgi:hypothetical protein